MPLKLSAKVQSQEADDPAFPLVDVIPEIPSVQAMMKDAKSKDGKQQALDFGEDLAKIQKMAGPVLALMGIGA